MLPTAPSFRIPIRSQRCLIPVDSFYVWQNRGISQIPHRVFSENQPVLLLAGLWDVWKDPFKTIHTFSIIITKAHNRLRDITNWVPVVFNTRDAAEMWLEPQGLSEIITLVRGQHIPALQSYRVSETINSLNVNSIDVQKQDIIVPTLFD
jgi:putative SOS response-associated peptidase YedK